MSEHTQNYVPMLIADLRRQLVGIARTIARRGRHARATSEELEQIAAIREQIAYLRRRDHEGDL